MTYYYTLLPSKTQAFLLERRMKLEGILCEITYMPREIMTDLCNLGVKFEEHELVRAVEMIRNSCIPGCRLFKEVPYPEYFEYQEVKI